MRKYFVSLYLAYLRFFARLQLAKVKPTIIGVGGSSGKTSLVGLISQTLSQKYKVKQSHGKNSETGIPLSILNIETDDYSFFSWLKIAFLCPLRFITNNEKYEVFVVEMGIDSPLPPKDMGTLLRLISPDIAVLTNINIEHSEMFDDLVKTQSSPERREEILKLISNEETKLLLSLGEKGKAVLNIDDPNINKLSLLKSKTVTVSAKDKKADLFVSDIKLGLSSFAMDVAFLGENYRLTIDQPLPKYFASTFALCLATSFSMGISMKEAISAIEKNFSLPPGRFSVFSGTKSTILIDSSYNSSLEAALGGLEAVSEVAGKRRKVGILGDMRELGSLSRIQHEALAKGIMQNLEFAILVGPSMRDYTVPILSRAEFPFISYATFSEAKEDILKSVKTNDLIFIKGSQNTLFLERAVELLLENKEDKLRLCRRGKYWEKIRKKAP